MTCTLRASRVRPGRLASQGGTQEGSALLLTLMLSMVLGSLAAGLVLMIITESAVSRRHQQSVRLRYAAEAGIEIGIQRLRRLDDWSLVPMASGGAAGAHASRPGAAAGWALLDARALSAIAPAGRDGGERVLTWVADDDEPDGDPSRDVNQRLRLRAESRGARDARHVVEALVARRAGPDGTTAVRVLAWSGGQE